MVKAQEMETKLEEEEKVCNDTTTALWEECKPCLKNTCVKYYSRTCSSGSGMVGRQVGKHQRTLSFPPVKPSRLTSGSPPPAAGGCVESDSSLLHLDQRGEDGCPGEGRPAAEEGVLPPGGEVRRDGRRRGQHLFRQHEGTKHRKDAT